MREWQYWTRNKLAMLDGYLPAFNRASQKSSERIYIDLMAGEIDNVDGETGEQFDGSALLALKSSPGFTRLAFGEVASKATELERVLRDRFPQSNFDVYAGDCNQTIDKMLASARKFDPGKIRADQVARTGGPPAEE